MSDTARRPAAPQGGFGRGPGGGRGGPPGMFGGGGPAEKPKDAKKTIRFLLTYFAPRRGRLTLVFTFAVLSTIFTIVGPKLMGLVTTKLFDGLISKYGAVLLHKPMPSMDFTYIGGILIMLVGFYLISTLFSYVQQYTMAGVSQGIVYDMRKDVNAKLARLPLKYFDSKTHGEIMSRVTNDIDNISTSLQQSVTQLITSVCTIVGVLVMMLTISPWLTLIALVTLPVSALSIMRITKSSQKSFAAQQKELGALNGHVEEMYTGHVIVKAFGRETDSVREFRDINSRLFDAAWKAQFISGVIMPMMNFINNLGYVLICVVGGLMAAGKVLKLGDIQAFIQYSRQFTQPIAQTANIANVLQSTLASAERVLEILEEEDDVADAKFARR